MRRLPSYGQVLVNGSGRTLYVFTPERGGKVKCTGSCASLWPPLTVPAGGKPRVVGAAIHHALISTVPNPSGGSIATYAGWPLHTYAQDTTAGSTNGQGIGGQWYMISPAGKVITKKAGSSSSSGSSGGYGY